MNDQDFTHLILYITEKNKYIVQRLLIMNYSHLFDIPFHCCQIHVLSVVKYDKWLQLSHVCLLYHRIFFSSFLNTQQSVLHFKSIILCQNCFFFFLKFWNVLSTKSGQFLKHFYNSNSHSPHPTIQNKKLFQPKLYNCSWSH